MKFYRTSTARPPLGSLRAPQARSRPQALQASISTEGSTGTNGTSVSGAVTLLVTNTGVNDLGNAVAGSTIDPTSFFAYEASATATGTLETANPRSIGRLIVGAASGSNVSTLALGTAITSAGDINIQKEGVLALEGFNYTESHAATSDAGGLSGTGTLENGSTGTATTLTLDATDGSGSFSGFDRKRRHRRAPP